MLPSAVQRQVDDATKLQAERGSETKTAVSSADPSAGIIEKLRADLAMVTSERDRMTSAYNVLRGKYDAEVPRLAEEIRTLKGKNQEIQGTLDRANIQPGKITSLTADERETAGPLEDITAKIAREVAAEAVNAAVKPLQETITVLVRQSDEAFNATLEMGLPKGWDTPTGVNEDPKFIAWLGQIDPNTQRTRMDALKRAEAAKQGHKVVEIFRAFMEAREIGASAEQAPPQKKPGIDPPQSGADKVQETEGDGKKRYTVAWIQQFYKTKRTNPEFQGEEGQVKAHAIEVDIAAAQREGRVTRD